MGLDFGFDVVDVDTILSLGATVIFYVLVLAFTFQAIFLAYHWFTYGTSRSISLTALAVYLTGAAVCLLSLSLILPGI